MSETQADLNNLEPEKQAPATNKIPANKWVLIVSILSGGFVISTLLLAGSIVYVGKLWIDSRVQPESLVNNEEVIIADVKIPESAPMLGGKEAKVTLVEFADYQCPFCGIFHKETFPELKRDYIDSGKVRFYYQDFAFLGEESVLAAEAAKCSGEQNKYWEYHDYLYSNQKGENEGAFALDNLKNFAGMIGLNKPQFNACLDSGKYKAQVEEETRLGESYGVAATPTIFVNGKKIEGAGNYEEYRTLIEEELSK